LGLVGSIGLHGLQVSGRGLAVGVAGVCDQGHTDLVYDVGKGLLVHNLLVLDRLGVGLHEQNSRDEELIMCGPGLEWGQLAFHGDSKRRYRTCL
jgi:hypothetical protein